MNHGRERRKRRGNLESSARGQFIYRVQPEILAVPDWAFARGICVPGFEATRDCIWLFDPVLTKLITKLDAENGGKTKVERFERATAGAALEAA